jgi:microcystin degradation protein MlrC
MVKKIAVASIFQETCSFNSVKTTMEDFTNVYFKQGPDVVNVPANDWVTGGFVDVMKSRGVELEGIVALHDTAGGALSNATFAEIKEMLLSRLRKAGRFDALFLALHGAMASEDEPDTEGVILSEVRELVGKECFLGVVLDHHANVTAKMVGAPDVMLAFETQPHDLPATGVKAARVMLDIWERSRTPHAALVKIPMLTPQDQFLTSGGPMKEWFDLAREIEKDPEVIVASTCPTQPWLDVPETGWSCLVYADRAEKAQACAERLARKAWDLRERFWLSARTSLAATIAAANTEARGLVVISDTGDSTYGGAPGDSTAIIAEMRKQGLNAPALIPVVDPAALEQAIQAGVGRTITLHLGGKMSPEFFATLEIEGVVRAIAGAAELDFGDGVTASGGRTVLFESGQMKIAILERRDRAINHPALYERLGVDVAGAKMVVLKTASNFQYFKKFQSRLIRADTPGATQSDLAAFHWRHISHPTYPFDAITEWSP